VTTDGTLYLGVHAGNRDVEIAPLDLDSATTRAPVKPIQRFTGTNDDPDWSPDGKLARLRLRSRT